MTEKNKLVRCPNYRSILEIDTEGLARELAWWELLDWSKMKNTFDRLKDGVHKH